MQKKLRAAVVLLGTSMTCVFPAPVAQADNSLFGLDFGQSELLDGLGDFWREISDDFRLKLGAGTSVAPRFEGADDYKIRVMPKISLRYKNLIALNNTRLRVFVVHNDSFVSGVQARYGFGRDEDASPKLTGMGDVGDSFELGGFIEWRPGWAVMGVEFG